MTKPTKEQELEKDRKKCIFCRDCRDLFIKQGRQLQKEEDDKRCINLEENAWNKTRQGMISLAEVEKIDIDKAVHKGLMDFREWNDKEKIEYSTYTAMVGWIRTRIKQEIAKLKEMR